MKPDEVVERIRKALRLARKAATDGEREAAMNAAKRMAQNAGIDLSEVEADGVSDGGKLITVHGRKVDIDAVETQLAAWIISRHFSIAVAFERMRRGGVKVLWIGNSINIGVAQYAWDIMLRESEKSFSEISANAKNAALDRGLFMRGFFFSIDSILTEHPLRNDIEQAEAERNAAQNALEKRKADDSMEMKGTADKGEGKDADALIKGLREGAKVRLNRPMGSRATKARREVVGGNSQRIAFASRS